jgi:hypothetical protein
LEALLPQPAPKTKTPARHAPRKDLERSIGSTSPRTLAEARAHDKPARFRVLRRFASASPTAVDDAGARERWFGVWSLGPAWSGVLVLSWAALATGCAAPAGAPGIPPEREPGALASADHSLVVELASASSVTPPVVAPDQPPPGKCPSDMVLAGSACIDRYEAPNIRGEKPLLMQSVHDAETFCASKDKRMCTEDEWVRACEGPSHRKFPYGDTFVAGRCNDDGTFLSPDWNKLGTYPAETASAEVARLDQSEAAGSRAACVSEEGVFDLTGNAGEWVVRTQSNPTNYSHVLKGCFWGKCFRAPHEPSCDYVNYAHPAGFRSYEMSFRCCSDPRP